MKRGSQIRAGKRLGRKKVRVVPDDPTEYDVKELMAQVKLPTLPKGWRVYTLTRGKTNDAEWNVTNRFKHTGEPDLRVHEDAGDFGKVSRSVVSLVYSKQSGVGPSVRRTWRFVPDGVADGAGEKTGPAS